MSATGYTPIQLYRTSTASATPSAGNLADGELAINLTDEKLYFKNASGVVKMLASSASALGTVSSVDVSGGTTGLTTSGGPITTSGTITLAGTLAAANGGTGQSSYTTGDLLYASGATTLSKLADVATGNALISGGVGVAPAWGKIGLTTHVSGTLPVANGGTGTSTAFTAGSIVFAGASGTYSQDNTNLFWDDTNNRLGIGTSTPNARLDVSAGVGSGALGSDAVRISASMSSGGTYTGGLGFYNSHPSFLAQLAGIYSGTDAASQLSGPLIFATAPTFGGTITERMRITSAGYVGIGTSNPTASLVVRQANNTSDGTRIFANGDDSQLITRYLASTDVWSINATFGASGAYKPITIMTSDLERVRVTTAGSVGIGTSSPGSLLDVAGQGSFTTDSGGSYGVRVRARASDNNVSVLALTNNAGSTNWARIIAFGSPAPFQTFEVNGAEAMRITGGNVGIGTTTVNYKLTVNGSIASTSSSGGIGYGTGSGGTVTQTTSRTTGVTLNRPNGAITLVSAAGLATWQSFTVTNSTVAATDTVIVNQKSGTDLYQIFVTNVAAGSFQITFATTGGVTTEQPVFNFAVIKGVTS